MGAEYKAKTFKSGNSVALRLPKVLGIKAGLEMTVREKQGGFVVEPAPAYEDKIDLTGVYGSIPGINRLPFDDKPRDWE